MLNWSEFADLLKPAEQLIEETTAPVDAQLRADLRRQLAMNAAQAYFLIFGTDPQYPEFVPFENSVFLLQPNPDAVYHYTQIDPLGKYRITGRRGNAIVANITVGNRVFGMDEKPGKGLGEFDVDSFTLDSKGCFDVLFSAELPAGYNGDWRPLHPEADFILLRQFSYDWGVDEDVRIAIERLDPVPPRARMAVEEIDARLKQLAAYVTRVTRIAMGAVRRPHDQGFINKFHLHTFNDMGTGKGWPQAYFETVFEIGEGEALVIESELPEQRHYWNVQVIDGLWNQVDVAYRQSSLNGLTAAIDDDGVFRAVLSATDPGYANWLDTGDHLYGMLIGRWNRCSSQPVPAITRMKLSEVDSYLGERSPRISAAGRFAQMRKRNVGNQLRCKW
jgi:hypothetical protein